MILNKEQIQRFKDLHKGDESFAKYTDEEVEEIANGVVNFYLTLYNIDKRIKREKPEEYKSISFTYLIYKYWRSALRDYYK